MAKRLYKDSVAARERLMDAAYDLFAARGVGQTGIDAILAESGCAKATLYDNFDSKLDLAVAFLDRREQRWTREWLEAEITQRTSDPAERLLAIFDVFDGWFQRKDFEGCSFINVLLESSPGSPLRRAAAAQLAKIRTMICDLAKEARLPEPNAFAQAWHMLMKGSIIAAGEGNRNAARQAKRGACMILAGWPGAERNARRVRPRRQRPDGTRR